MNRVQQESYEKEMEKRLEGLYGRVDEIKDFVDENAEEAEAELQKHLDAIRQDKNRVQDQWKALQGATQDTWDDIRAELDDAVSDLNQTLLSSREYVESKFGSPLGWTEGFTEHKEHDSAGWPEGAGEITNGSEGWPEGAGEVEENSEGWTEGFDKEKKTTA